MDEESQIRLLFCTVAKDLTYSPLAPIFILRNLKVSHLANAIRGGLIALNPPEKRSAILTFRTLYYPKGVRLRILESLESVSVHNMNSLYPMTS